MTVLTQIEGPFDPAFALTGGSDAYLGRDLAARGHRFFWADEAVIHETVPPERTTVRWLLQRRFRTGGALAKVRARLQGRARGTATVLIRATGAVVVGLLSMLKGLATGRQGVLEGLMIAAFGAGGLFALLGGEFREYASRHDILDPRKEPDTPSPPPQD